MLDIQDVILDDEFCDVLPALTDDEREQLTQQVKRFGFLTPIVVWLGHCLLLDGYNRYDIWLMEMGGDPALAPDIVEMTFPDRQAAIEYIKQNQRGRRNLSPEQIAYLIGDEHRREKKSEGAPKGSKNASKNNSVTVTELNETAEMVAEKHGVSPRTVERNAKFADAVDAIAESLGPEAKDKILSGETGLSRKDVIAVAQLPKEEQARAIETGTLSADELAAGDDAGTTAKPEKQPQKKLPGKAVPGWPTTRVVSLAKYERVLGALHHLLIATKGADPKVKAAVDKLHETIVKL